MKKLICTRLLSVSLLENANAQTVYFQRGQGSSPGNPVTVSSVPFGASSTMPTDLASNLTNPLNGGVVFDQQNTIYYSDAAGLVVYSVTKSGAITTVVSSSAGIVSPQALALDTSNQHLYIYDSSNARIVRADLSQTLPIMSVQVFASGAQTTAVTDIKFNPVDNKVYWTDNGTVYRSAATIPATPEALSTQGGLSISALDFDQETTQSIYLVDNSVSFKGIYKAALPASPNNSLTESHILDLSSDLSISIVGFALERNGSGMCYSGFSGIQGFIRCGDRAQPASLIELLRDPGDNSIMNAGPSFLTIESAPAPTPTPTATATATATATQTPDPVVRPDTKPAAPQVSVGGSSKKPSATIVLQSFTGVEVSKLRAIIEAAMKSKKKGKVGFQYRVQVSATKDAAGNPVSKKLKDIRNLTSKRNTLTVKNLKANSTYDVNYRVEITRKLPGEKPKVFKKTPLSPTSSFVVQ